MISVDSPHEFVTFFSNNLRLVTSFFWTEEQREQYVDDMPLTLLRYLERAYGKDKPIATDWVAITATARKPVYASLYTI